MILVTGTMRSGTSMWMQVLEAANLPVIGDRFPSVWGESIRDANPNGFYESPLRRGIFFATNPDPRTGAWLSPAATKRHVVKVFIPGLIRSDVAFLDRVIVTMRHWREVDASLRALYRLEDVWLTEQRKARPEDQRLQTSRSPLPPAIDWFFQHYEAIRDVATRRYPVHFCTYDRLLEDPRTELERVFAWLGVDGVDAATKAIEPGLRRSKRREGAVDDVAQQDEAIFDAMFDAVHATGTLSADLLAAMDEANTRLETQWMPTPQRERNEIGPGTSLG